MLQFSVPHIVVGPLGKFDDLCGHIDKDHDERWYDDQKDSNGHEERDRVVSLREEFSQLCVDRIEGKGQDRSPENSREEWRKNEENFIDDEGKDRDKEERNELFTLHGDSLADSLVLARGDALLL